MLSHYPPVSGEPGQRCMYNTLRLEFYWPCMAANIKRTVSKCQSCACNNPIYLHKRKLHCFPVARPFYFIAMDILKPFSKMTQHNQYILVITDRYSKLTFARPTSKIASTHIESHFFDHWLALYATPTYLLTNNSIQFSSKFFATLFTLLIVKHLTKTAYRRQTSGQTKGTNKTILTPFYNTLRNNKKIGTPSCSR